MVYFRFLRAWRLLMYRRALTLHGACSDFGDWRCNSARQALQRFRATFLGAYRHDIVFPAFDNGQDVIGPPCQRRLDFGLVAVPIVDSLDAAPDVVEDLFSNVRRN